ncbi:(S)-2-haloacid dehalogenase 4A [compost metagenome]
MPGSTPLPKPFPRVRELLDRLKAAGFKLVVASSAGEDELEALLRVAGAAELTPSATSSDDAERSKPDPDIVEAAVERAGYPIEQVLLIGDTPYDIEAAMRTGVGVIALRCGGWDDEALERAVAIYDDAADLLSHFENSPLMRRGLAKRHTP